MRFFTISALIVAAHALQLHATAPSKGPFRKIINLLNNLRTEIQTEAAAEKKIFDHWLCWAQNLQGSSQQISDDSSDKIAQAQATRESAAADQARLQQEAAEHNIDAERAHSSIEQAKSLREHENAQFVKDQDNLQACIKQSRAALDALAKAGTSGAASTGIGELGYETTGFLQANTEMVKELKHLATQSKALDDDQQDALTSFLEGKTSGANAEQVAGMLRSIEDNCMRDMDAVTEQENARQTSYHATYDSNSKLLAASTEAANTKTARAADKLQESVDAANQVAELEISLKAAQQRLAMLNAEIPLRKKQATQRQTDMNAEVAAINEAMNALYDADSSFLQVSVRTHAHERAGETTELRKEAMTALKKAVDKDPRVAMIALQLNSKAVSFERVIKLINDMTTQVERDQKAADDHYAYCEKRTQELKEEKEKLANHGQVLQATIDREVATQESLSNEENEQNDQLRENGKARSDATENRNNDAESYRTAQAESDKTIELLSRAIEVLAAYYDGQSGAGEGTQGSVSMATGGFGFIQLGGVIDDIDGAAVSTGTASTDGSAASGRPVQVFTTAAPNMYTALGGPSVLGVEPDGISNKSWGGSKKGRMAVKMLQEAKDDAAQAQSQAQTNEQESAAEYNALMTRLEESDQACKVALIEIRNQQARSQEKMVMAEQNQAVHAKDLEMNRAARLLNDKECADLLNTHVARTAVRKQEIEAMNSAIAVLRNYQDNPAPGGHAFLF